MVKSCNYVAVAAGQNDAALGPAAVGVLLDRLSIVVTTAATSAVTLTDGNVAIPLIPDNTPVGTYRFELGIRSKVATGAGWKVTTGAGASVLAVLG